MAATVRPAAAVLLALASRAEEPPQRRLESVPYWWHNSLACLNSQFKVLMDQDKGWKGQCDGLTITSADTQDKCRVGCETSANCSVWQWWGGEATPGCWADNAKNKGYNCHTGQPDTSKQILGAQRLQHGHIVVKEDFKAVEIKGLFTVGVFLDISTSRDESITRCKNTCYSDIGCRYWTYGSPNGCKVERASAGSVYKGSSISSAEAKQVVKGESIEHVCKIEEASPEEELVGKLPVILAILVAIAAIAALVLLVLMCSKSKPPPPERKSRSVRVAARQEEQPLVTMLVPAPQPQMVVRQQPQMVMVPGQQMGMAPQQQMGYA